MSGASGPGAWWAAWLADVEEFALPQRCPSCDRLPPAREILCRACLAAVPRLDVPLCVRCLVAGRDPDGCERHPGYRAWAAWIYDERAALVLHALKYQDRPGLASTLGAEIAGALPSAYRPDLVLEVPLHATRRRERGYNQAAGLADAVAKRVGCPRVAGALRRVRPTPSQAWLGPRARRANLVGAFQATEPRALEGREILIVDDVITTGSTLDACLEALRACGARALGAALAWAA